MRQYVNKFIQFVEEGKYNDSKISVLRKHLIYGKLNAMSKLKKYNFDNIQSVNEGLECVFLLNLFITRDFLFDT